MKRLNRDAARLAGEFGLRGATDITGFSLLGHALEMAQASGVRFRLSFAQIPFVSAARRYADQWTFPGGAADNALYFGQSICFAEQVGETERMMLFDPQTSGGLLLCVPDGVLDAFLSRAKAVDQPAWVIGEVLEGSGLEVDA